MLLCSEDFSERVGNVPLKVPILSYALALDKPT